MKIILSGLMLFHFVLSPRAFAALGDSVTSIAADQTKLSAKMKSANVFQKYTVQEMSSDANTTKEFVNSNGVVFAVTWQGIDPPDLSVVLGSYYEGYQKSAKETPRVAGRRQREVKRENLVVQNWGQMRSLRGRAYDPSLIPAGVSLNEIK